MSASDVILVVDDNENNRDLISRRLQRAGYQVLTASDGARALELLRLGGEAPAGKDLGGNGIDLVVLDVMMPGLTGIDVLRRVRARFSPTELPVIMATAKDQSEDVVEALEHGANDYVTKPLDFPIILARIRTQLKMKAAANKPAPAAARLPDDADFVSLVAAIRPGMVLGGKYRLVEELGAGNFGAVYRADHLGFQQPVAVKVLQTSVEDSPEALARFQQEGRSAFRLQHPNAVAVMDFSVTPGGLAYLVMELLEGHTLEAELRQWRRLPERRAAAILLPVCEVLHEAHGLGIIHRDVKPANIFLHRGRREEVVKVLDFGIAKLVGDAAMNQSLTMDEGILGTPAYMAPERLWGKPYDGRADAYSVGIMLYQMLAGRPPFVSEHNEAMAVAMMHVTHEPERLASFRPDVSKELEAAVMAMLVKDQSKRPTVADLAREVARILDLDLPASLRRLPAAQPDELDVELAFVFAELLAPPPAPQEPSPPPEETTRQSGTASLALYPPAATADLWWRR
jgi:serine/threonine protein kinase/CheY-like chemotaxis protein